MPTIHDIISNPTRTGYPVFVVDDGGIYNVIPASDFDEKGRYIPNKSYTDEDFDVVMTFRNADPERAMADAFEYCDELNEEAEQ